MKLPSLPKIYMMIATVMIVAIGAIFVCFHNQNKMAVNLLDTTVEDLSRPWKKTYFDASEWLDQKDRYIKINDYDLIDLNFRPLEIKEDSYALFSELHWAIKKGIGLLSGLEYFADMSDELDDFTFSKAIYTTNIQSEYLHTSFDRETFKPTNDFFLMSLIYNNSTYEFFVKRYLYHYENNQVMDMYTILIARKGKDSIRKREPYYFAYDEYVIKHNLPNRNQIKAD